MAVYNEAVYCLHDEHTNSSYMQAFPYAFLLRNYVALHTLFNES